MTAVIHYGNTGQKISMGNNVWLMLIQQVTLARFSDNEGFYLTVVGASDDGDAMKSSYWLHPSIPLHFQFDPHQDQILVDVEVVDGWITISRSDLGMIIGELDQMPYMLPKKTDPEP